MEKTRAAITAVGAWVPEYRLTNEILTTMVETSDEWIKSRTGIEERRILKGENMGTSHMGVNAIKDLLTRTNVKPEDIDLIICATTTPDMVFPATANIICDKVGAVNAFSYDINAACSGFIFALTTASKFIESGAYKNIIVVGGDKMSSIIDYTDRKTCVIFGDGAGAVLLQPDSSGNGIQDAILKSDGSGVKYLHQKAGGSAYPATAETVANKEHFVFQDGQPVFKFAVTKMADVAAEIMDRNNLTSDDISWLVPHQANKRIIDATARRMGIPAEKAMVNIQKYGNTTNGTIPICLDEWQSKLKKGDNIVLAAFGGGFTWGSVFIKWAI